MTDRIRYEQDGAVAEIKFARPDLKNRLDRDFTSELVACLERIDGDRSVKCAIISAEGKTFCAGGDIKAMYERAGHFSGGPAENYRTYLAGVQRLARTFAAIDVPVIAAVGGAAMGAGLDITAMCDIRIASNEAKFAESFIRLGLVSAAGGAWLLQRAVGSAAAAELTLTGATFDANRALELGFVSRVTTAEALLPTAREIAGQIAAHPALSIRLNKRLLRESASLPLGSALELAASLQGIIQHTDDQREAVAATVEKRNPRYTGR